MSNINPSAPLQVTIYPQDSAAGAGASQFWSGSTPNFKDLLDTINPLQHIPVVSSIYQSMTGDVPSSGANIAGGTLLGGPFGFVSALMNEIVKTQSGKDIGSNLLAMLNGDFSPAATQTVATQSVAGMQRDGLSANQRAGYNAYVNASMLA